MFENFLWHHEPCNLSNYCHFFPTPAPRSQSLNAWTRQRCHFFLSVLSLITNIFKDTISRMCCCLEMKVMTAGKEFNCSQCFGVSHEERAHFCWFNSLTRHKKKRKILFLFRVVDRWRVLKWPKGEVWGTGVRGGGETSPFQRSQISWDNLSDTLSICVKCNSDLCRGPMLAHCM